jgi:hypothetical protein
MSYLKPLLFTLIATSALSACQVEPQKSVLKSPMRDRMETRQKKSLNWSITRKSKANLFTNCAAPTNKTNISLTK